MPRLPKKVLGAARKAETQDRSPLPDGLYTCKLVKAEMAEGPRGPYLKCEYRVSEGDYENRPLWTNLSYSVESAWKMREFLDAYGVTDADDVDTDELIGVVVQLQVSVQVINQGPRKGQKGNQVEAILSADAEPEDTGWDEAEPEPEPEEAPKAKANGGKAGAKAKASVGAKSSNDDSPDDDSEFEF